MYGQHAVPVQKPWEDSESESDGDFEPSAKSKFSYAFADNEDFKRQLFSH